jgi:undecaprenyl-diphosphatase
MNWFETLVLAVVQGLTEFLPISSDGHLVLGAAIFGGVPEGFLRYELLLHLGTLLAALLYYRQDVLRILRALISRSFDPATRESRRIAQLIVAALVPTFVVVKSLEGFFESLHGIPASAVVGLALNGAMLVGASRWAPAGTLGLMDTPWWKAALIGLAQCAAPVPGISRSGTTIVAALFCGLRREDAVRFSFLLSIPTVGGAVALKLAEGLREPLAAGQPAVMASGIALAALTGYLAILLVLRWTREGRLWQFGLYCWAAAALAAALLPRG